MPALGRDCQGSWDSAIVYRIRTHLITEKDDIVRVVERYVPEVAEPGDMVGIAESVVAITQGRAIPPESIRPGSLARFIAKFADPDASISAPRSMQAAMDMVGIPRILLAAAAGALGKALGKRGFFFRVAGHQVAEIDDSGGTMPPYDRSIILGPKDPEVVARKIWRKTGLCALILDVNDLGCVDILGSSFRLSDRRANALKALLKTNPFGNDDQKTPLVIMKPRRKRPEASE